MLSFLYAVKNIYNLISYVFCLWCTTPIVLFLNFLSGITSYICIYRKLILESYIAHAMNIWNLIKPSYIYIYTYYVCVYYYILFVFATFLFSYCLSNLLPPHIIHCRITQCFKIYKKIIHNIFLPMEWAFYKNHIKIFRFRCKS